MQQIQDRHTEGRPRLAILDDQLDGLEVTLGKLASELAATEAPTEDCQESFAKQRLMPIVRDLIQTIVIGKTPGHQPASMEVLDLMEQQFLAAAGNDLLARIACSEIDTEAKRKKLLDQYGEELKSQYLEWENLQV